MNDEGKRDLAKICIDFCADTRKALRGRFEAWPIDAMKEGEFAVIGGLLARQVTIAEHFYKSPQNWNNHIAPIFFRSMIDLFINISWILQSPATRSKAFIQYGLGQAVLENEHRKAMHASKGSDYNTDPIYLARKQWIDFQEAEFKIDVNIGNWGDRSIKEMAEDVGLKNLYHFAYSPFSAATHSTWQHISQFNLALSDNPLHRFILVPIIPDSDIEVGQLVLAGQYLARTFRAFDEWAKFDEEDSSYDIFLKEFQNWCEKFSSNQKEESNF